jgi:hypothetical protein
VTAGEISEPRRHAFYPFGVASLDARKSSVLRVFMPNSPYALDNGAIDHAKRNEYRSEPDSNVAQLSIK